MIVKALATRRRGGTPPPVGTQWATASGITLSNGNKTATKTSGGGSFNSIIATGGWVAGAHYFEAVLVDTSGSPFNLIGLAPSDPLTYPGGATNGWGYYEQTGEKYRAAAPAAYGAWYGNGDVIGVGYNATLGVIEFFKNGTSQGVAFTSVSGLLYPSGGIYNGGNSMTLHTLASEIVSLPVGYSTWE